MYRPCSSVRLPRVCSALWAGGVGRSAAMAASVPASSVRSLTRVPSVNPSDSEALAVAVRKLEVPVANINDGSVLMKLAEEHLQSLKRLVPSRPAGPEGDLTWGSMCSGSEGPHFAFLVHALPSTFPALQSACPRSASLTRCFFVTSRGARSQKITSSSAAAVVVAPPGPAAAPWTPHM